MNRLDLILKTTPSVVLALMLITAPVGAKSNWQKVCKDHTHQGFGEHKIKTTALRIALHSWVNTVVAHDGESWANITKNAAHCQRVAVGNTIPWQCQIDYKSCKSVPIDLPMTSTPTPRIKINP